MNDRSSNASGAEPEVDATQAGLVAEVRSLSRAIFASRAGRPLIILMVTTVLIVTATAYGQIRLNGWNKPFYDALSRRDLREFLYQLGVFFLIAACLLVLNVTQRWLTETLELKLREGLVQSLVEDWMQPRRAFWLANAGAIGVNPDQRMHEDARHLSELSADLGIGLLQASILFGTFAGVLWGLSSAFSFRIGDRDFAIPGFMLWAAVLYASAGSLMSLWVGRGLVGRNAERYAREADLRFSLVRANEHVDAIALAQGEGDEKRRIERNLGDVLAATRRIIWGHTRLTWVTAGFGWVTNVAPILVAAPLYFMGKISFGGLMMAAGAFTQAQSSLRWFIDNFSAIADWRATLFRVAAFRHALVSLHEPQGFESRITYTEGEPGVIAIDNLEIVSAANADRLKETSTVVRAGARVLILGAPGTGKTQLFRALAGLWPWGSGEITRPRGEQIFYLPRGTPYLPRGTLREVLAYPLKPESFSGNAYTRALYRLGVERLAVMLDETHRWDRVLSQDEQLSLVFARILIQAPPWVLIDGTFGSLDDDVLEIVRDVFDQELKSTGVIHIGGPGEAHGLFSTVLHLVKSSGAARRLAGLLLVSVLAVVVPRPSGAQSFEFNAPQSAADAKTPAVMRDLAERLLPVYQESDPDRYLANLSVLQLTAGDYAAAVESRESLHERRRRADSGRAVGRGRVLDIYARAMAIQAESHLSASEALGKAYQEVFAGLSDHDAFLLSGWLSAAPEEFRGNFQHLLDEQRSKDIVSQQEAEALLSAYVYFETYRALAPWVGALNAADDAKRYAGEQISIQVPGRGSVAATVIRPKGASAALPALLELGIDRPTVSAKESAAHGYVGVFADMRRGTAGAAAFVPYQHDGETARAVLDWIARQPWSDGRTAMYGEGYSGFTAWAAAARLPPSLKAIAVWDPAAPGVDAPMAGGIFQNSAYRWSLEVTNTRQDLESSFGDEAVWRALDEKWYRSGRRYRDLGGLFGRPNPIFIRWLNHPSYDRFWQTMIPYQGQFARIDFPVLTMTGYFSAAEPAALYYFTEHHRYDPRADHTLLIGPYDGQAMQSGASASIRGYDVDVAALVDLRELRYQWLDHALKGTETPAQLGGRVNVEVMGANEWRHGPSLEAMADGSLKFYLSAGAADAAESRRLIRRRSAKPAAVDQIVSLTDRSDAGWLPPSELITRSLVTHNSLTFVSGPLKTPTDFNGLLSGRLDFTVNKMDMDIDIAAYALTAAGDYVRLFNPADELRLSYAADRRHRHLLKAGERQKLAFFGQRMTSRRLEAGSRLVIVLRVSKRPDREINYGTGNDVSEESIEDGRTPIKVRWYNDSYIEIPVSVQAAPGREGTPSGTAGAAPAHGPH